LGHNFDRGVLDPLVVYRSKLKNGTGGPSQHQPNNTLYAEFSKKKKGIGVTLTRTISMPTQPGSEKDNQDFFVSFIRN